MSELLWIALPGGTVGADDRAPLAVAIVLRLTEPGSALADHGLDRWPDLLAATTFELELRHAGGAVETVALAPERPHPQAEMLAHWQAMFVTPTEAGAPPHLVQPPAAADPASAGLEVLATTAEASGVEGLYQAQVAGEDTSGALGEVIALTQPRTLRTVRAARSPARRGQIDPREFHRFLALLREHPAVLRALGLIVDFRVSVPADVEAVRIAPALPPWPVEPAPRPARPWTRCALADRRFLPEPGPDSGLLRGLVRLDGAGPPDPQGGREWSVVTFDVDAAIVRIAEQGGEPLPGLRSAGLALLNSRREHELLGRLGRGNRGGSPDGAELFAEDLVLGYRADVSDQPTGGWRTLCARRARYTIAERAIGPEQGVVEESAVKRDAFAQTSDDGPLEGDEQVLRWDGWSLAVPRPAPEIPERTRVPSALDWSFSAEPPLPRLRFDRDYRLRLRLADLAGGGLTVADLAAEEPQAAATASILYARVEPVPAPLVTDPAPTGRPGDALLRLVVRSLGGPGAADATPTEPARRLLSAPPVSIELADQHGVFDGLDPDASWALARRALPGVGGERRAPAAGRPDASLPDPAAVEWVLRERGLGLAAHGRWDALPGSGPLEHPRLELELTGGPTALSQVGATVRAALPPGATVELDVSSAPDAARVRELALDRQATVGTLEAVRSDVLAGRQPQITPARTLQLVHAVQRPLARPTGDLSAQRKPGETSAVVRVSRGWGVERPTTARIDVTATWREWSDEGAGPKLSAHVGSEAVTVQPAGLWVEFEHRLELGDTRYRRVTCTPTAVSRFQDYFAPALAEADPKAFAVDGDSVALDVLSSARPAAPVVVHSMPGVASTDQAPEPGWRDWQRTRRGGLLRVHLGPSWYSSGEGERLAVIVSADPFPTPEAWPFLSEAGRDPAIDTSPPTHFPTPAHVAGGAGSATAHLEELGQAVMLVPLEPIWAELEVTPALQEGGEWFVDIDLGPLAQESYRPFVELALARYQPMSLEQMQLSPVVRSEVTQLLPDRTLILRREGWKVSVSLRGLRSDEPFSRVEAWVERWSDPLGDPPSTDFMTLASTPEPGLSAWVRVTEVFRAAIVNQVFDLAVPSDLSVVHRVVVREVEEMAQPGGGSTEPSEELGRRVVFADAAIL